MMGSPDLDQASYRRLSKRRKHVTTATYSCERNNSSPIVLALQRPDRAGLAKPFQRYVGSLATLAQKRTVRNRFSWNNGPMTETES